MASSTPPPPSAKSVIPFQAGRGNISMTAPAPGGMVPEYLSRTNLDRVAFPHADVTIDDTSENEQVATETVVRDEEPI